MWNDGRSSNLDEFPNNKDYNIKISCYEYPGKRIFDRGSLGEF